MVFDDYRVYLFLVGHWLCYSSMFVLNLITLKPLVINDVYQRMSNPKFYFALNGNERNKKIKNSTK